MPYDNKPGEGVFFPNDRKTEDRHPDYKGSINIDGVDHDIAGWKNKSKNGKSYLRLKVSAPYQDRAVDENRSRLGDDDDPGDF